MFVVLLSLSKDLAFGEEAASQQTENKETPVESIPTAPQVDRIGFPEQYATYFSRLRTVRKPDKMQMVTVYGNSLAAAITDPSQLPYPYGSVIVMESSSFAVDADGNTILDSENLPRKGEVLGLHVMRREPGFGVEYGANRTGEWEYVEYRPDGSYLTPPAKTFTCAECHLKAGTAKDWVFHGRFFQVP